MGEEYKETKGSNNDILCSDSAEVNAAIGNIAFEVHSTSATYSEEFLTLNYIDNLFKAIADTKEMWQNVKGATVRYHEAMDNVPTPVFPNLNVSDIVNKVENKEETYLSKGPKNPQVATPPTNN